LDRPSQGARSRRQYRVEMDGLTRLILAGDLNGHVGTAGERGQGRGAGE
jgi:hypothetical protein